MLCNTYNKLENFLTAVNNSLNDQETVTFNEKITTCCNLLEECVAENNQGNIGKLKFISEQLHFFS